MQSVALEVAFVLRVEIVGVAAAAGVGERRAQAGRRVEEETGDESAASAGGFGQHARVASVGFANQFLQSCKQSMWVHKPDLHKEK